MQSKAGISMFIVTIITTIVFFIIKVALDEKESDVANGLLCVPLSRLS